MDWRLTEMVGLRVYNKCCSLTIKLYIDWNWIDTVYSKDYISVALDSHACEIYALTLNSHGAFKVTGNVSLYKIKKLNSTDVLVFSIYVCEQRNSGTNLQKPFEISELLERLSDKPREQNKRQLKELKIYVIPFYQSLPSDNSITGNNRNLGKSSSLDYHIQQYDFAHMMLPWNQKATSLVLLILFIVLNHFNDNKMDIAK